MGDDPRGRFVAGIPHIREEGSNDAREGVEGTHEVTRSVVRRSESEDDLMRLAATSREAHLRHVAAAMAARDGGDGARGVEVPRTEVPPRDVGDVASVSPASSAPLAEVESLPEPARSQIEFFRRLSVESARPEEDGRGTIATEGGGAEGGAEVSQLCADGGADAQLCATVPPARGTDPDEPEQRTCRFCLGGEDEGAAGDDALIAPCRCRGTQGWVHHGCLREWQRVSVSSTGRVERRCRVCHSAFRTPRPPIKDVIKEWCVSFSLTCISVINLAIRMTSLRVQSCNRFNPTATDRLQCYRRAWWQMLSNSIMAQEGVEHIGTAGFHSWGWTGGASHARRVASELIRRAKSDVGVLNHHGHSHGRRSLLGGDAVVGSLGKVSRGKGGGKDDADVAKGAEGGAVPHEDSVDDAFFEDFSFSPGLRYFAALPDGFAVDSAIDPPTRAKLHAFYAPHVQALNALIGNGEIRWWDADGRDVAALQEETLLGDIREYESEQNERGEEELTGGVDPANFQEER